MNEKEYLYWLFSVEGAGAVTIRKMREYAGGLEQAYYIEEKEWEHSGILKGKLLKKNYGSKDPVSTKERGIS